MTIEGLFQLYQKHFVPIYSDYVSLTATKPEQILIEEENILSHISQAFNPKLSPEAQKANTEKAHNHLIRVILDTHKLVWAETKQKLDFFVLNKKHRLAFNIKESDVLKKYEEFIKRAREARRHEMANIGNDPLASIELYEDVNSIGNDLLGSLDELKANTISSWTRFMKTKEFMFAVIASLLAALLLKVFF